MRSDHNFHQQPWKLFTPVPQHSTLSFHNAVTSTMASHPYRPAGRESGQYDASLHHASQNGGSLTSSYPTSSSSFDQSNPVGLWAPPVPFVLSHGPTSADPPHRLLQTDDMPMLMPASNNQQSSTASHSCPPTNGNNGETHVAAMEKMSSDSEEEDDGQHEVEIVAKKRPSRTTAANKKRNTKACDGCRRQKCKCEPDPQRKSSCAQCSLLGQLCTYNDQSKKRGPPKGYISSIENRLHHMENILYELMRTQEPDGKSVLERLVGKEIMDDIYSGKIVLKKHHDPERRNTTRPGQGGKWKHSWWAAPLENRAEGNGKASTSYSAQECTSPSSTATTTSSPKESGPSAYTATSKVKPAFLNPPRQQAWQSAQAEANQNRYSISPKSGTQPSEGDTTQSGTPSTREQSDSTELAAGMTSAMDIRPIEAWSAGPAKANGVGLNSAPDEAVPRNSPASMTASVGTDMNGSASNSIVNPSMDHRNVLPMTGSYFNKPYDGASSQYGTISSSPAHSTLSLTSSFIPPITHASSPTNASVQTNRSSQSSDHPGILSSPWSFGNVHAISSSPYGPNPGVTATKSDSAAWVSPGMKIQDVGYLNASGLKRKRETSLDGSSMLPPQLSGAASNLYNGSPCSKMARFPSEWDISVTAKPRQEGENHHPQTYTARE
ncbi:hypothetical protein A4X13_0g1244 [Tilletia indica]|uniref:Uncharacterized protein n=1 Tax=Tilletia indica TaxID=43049 RepID=A0A177TY29_9BASI|nr:hypothetical protein A4X13_0g1244 [Tilletia indica]